MTGVVHVQPTSEFEPSVDDNFDHFTIVVEDSIHEVTETLDAAGVPVERELTPKGVSGTAPVVYVRHPFGD